MKIEEIVKRLHNSKRKILTLLDLKKLFDIEKDNTAYKTAENLVEKEILLRIKKGLYAFSFNMPSDFEIANWLYFPSYISLESALNFYGILPQFPYTITSITIKKPKKIIALDKEFEYVHISKNLFWGEDKQNDFLIAEKEKAFLDLIYIVSKGIRKIDFEDLDYYKIDKFRFRKMSRRVIYLPFKKLCERVNL